MNCRWRLSLMVALVLSITACGNRSTTTTTTGVHCSAQTVAVVENQRTVCLPLSRPHSPVAMPSNRLPSSVPPSLPPHAGPFSIAQSAASLPASLLTRQAAIIEKGVAGPTNIGFQANAQGVLRFTNTDGFQIAMTPQSVTLVPTTNGNAIVWTFTASAGHWPGTQVDFPEDVTLWSDAVTFDAYDAYPILDATYGSDSYVQKLQSPSLVGIRVTNAAGNTLTVVVNYAGAATWWLNGTTIPFATAGPFIATPIQQWVAQTLGGSPPSPSPSATPPSG